MIIPYLPSPTGPRHLRILRRGDLPHRCGCDGGGGVHD